MRKRLHLVNQGMLLFGFIVANLLWIKALFDIFAFQNEVSDFRFPEFFIPLFTIGALLAIGLSVYALVGVFGQESPPAFQPDPWIIFIWLAIPISVLCTAPVCYIGNIMHSPYWISTLLRWCILIVPLIAGLLYLKGNSEEAIFILLLVGFCSLIPNDKCYNPFNHDWIDRIGASPLTYLPTVFVMLFGITAMYGKNKYLITVVVYGLCIGALIISLGHRMDIIW